MIKTSRIFGGKKYSFRSSHHERADADRVARNLRSRGAFGRVIVVPKTKVTREYYVVYERGRGQK